MEWPRCTILEVAQVMWWNQFIYNKIVSRDPDWD